MYKNTKGGGDVKKGKYDPFAYIPLDPTLLNKRVRKQAIEKFKKFARASKKKGASVAGGGRSKARKRS